MTTFYKLGIDYSDELKKIIRKKIEKFAVLPNKFIMPLTKEISVESLKIIEPEVDKYLVSFITILIRNIVQFTN